MTNPIMKPILLAVDEHSHDLETIQQELLKRYGADYDVLAEQLDGVGAAAAGRAAGGGRAGCDPARAP